jgi:hypothetical protein
MAYRVVNARFKSDDNIEHLARLKLIGIDDVGIVNQITEIISKQQNVNMKSISFNSNDGIFEGWVEVYVYDLKHLETLIEKFEMVEGVKRTERWDKTDVESAIN